MQLILTVLLRSINASCHHGSSQGQAVKTQLMVEVQWQLMSSCLFMCRVSAVKGVISAVHATATLVSAPSPPSPPLRPSSVRTLSERHRHVAGRGAEVLEVGIHADHGRWQGDDRVCLSVILQVAIWPSGIGHINKDTLLALRWMTIRRNTVLACN